MKEVKKTTKRQHHSHHNPDGSPLDTVKPRLFGVAHVKDYEDLVGLE